MMAMWFCSLDAQLTRRHPRECGDPVLLGQNGFLPAQE